MRVLDLFAGVGGMSLGLERAGMETIAFAEVDDFCDSVLRRRWPNVENLGDVRGLSLSGLERCGAADWITGGEESPGLRPDWIVIENVHHTWRRWVPELRRELYRLGYASVPLRVSSAELGARHLRRRVIVVAHADGELLRELSGWWSRKGREVAAEFAESRDSSPRGLGADDGLSDWPHRRKALGNAVDPYCIELIGRAILESAA